MLYKYYNFDEYSVDVLKHGNLWASNPRYFNDPFDCLATLKFTNNDIDKLFMEWSYNKNICCFSKSYTNILMWSHYANNHTGFCICVDWPELEYSDLVSNVIYSRSFMQFNEKYFLKHKNGQINKNWDKLLLTKYIDWNYEEEVRLILESDKMMEKGGIFQIDRKYIKKVFFVFKMDQNNKENIKLIMSDTDCQFYQMKLSNGSFALEAVRLIESNNGYA